MTIHKLDDSFFRHEYGRLVSILSRRFSLNYFEQIEDAVQSALLSAVENWPVNGQPDNPAAWLYTVAQNNLLQVLRQTSRQRELLAHYIEETNTELDAVLQNLDEEYSTESSELDLLRLLFVCCNNQLPRESQLVFALKTLCGFSVKEVSLRLFTSEANVYKRFSRAKGFLKNIPRQSWDLPNKDISKRIENVLTVIYLMFTEGYLSVSSDFSIRLELCREAIRIADLLARNPVGQTPETNALLALMHLHLARSSSRMNESGGLLLLEEQNRTLWDQGKIAKGLVFLEKSAKGSNFSRFHAEAGIAAEHCLSPSFAETSWEKIAGCYELLERVSPSAIHRLNLAVVIAEWKGPEKGLNSLKSFEPAAWLLGSYLWFAVLADLNQRCGNYKIAKEYRTSAIQLAPTKAVKNLLLRRYKTGTSSK